MAAVIQSARTFVASAPPAIPHLKSNNRRATLQVLDACLTAIEDATERGDLCISPSLAMQIRRHVPLVVPGAPIVAAHEAVLSRQAVLLAGRNEFVPLGEARAELSEEQARHLCDQIRRGLGETSQLLQRAHEGRAWKALGYASWEQFVRAEFSLSRSRSYQLLDHATVMIALRSAANMDHLPVVSESVARQVKPVLAELVDYVRELANTSATSKSWDAESAIRSGIRKVQKSLKVKRQNGRGMSATVVSIRNQQGRLDIARLVDAVDYLADLLASDHSFDQLTNADLSRLGRVEAAAKCLTRLSATLCERSNGYRAIAT